MHACVSVPINIISFFFILFTIKWFERGKNFAMTPQRFWGVWLLPVDFPQSSIFVPCACTIYIPTHIASQAILSSPLRMLLNSNILNLAQIPWFSPLWLSLFRNFCSLSLNDIIVTPNIDNIDKIYLLLLLFEQFYKIVKNSDYNESRTQKHKKR